MCQPCNFVFLFIFSPGNSVNEFRTRLDIFVKESRRRQTDHAKNLLTGEKTHSMKEEREFADFVFKNGYWDDLMDFDVIQKIARAIMSAKIQFPATNKIYYSVVWVYYFDCQKQIADCTSLFKVYCDEDDNLAVFIDWQQNKYSSWNEYLCNFICLFLQILIFFFYFFLNGSPCIVNLIAIAALILCYCQNFNWFCIWPDCQKWNFCHKCKEGKVSGE